MLTGVAAAELALEEVPGDRVADWLTLTDEVLVVDDGGNPAAIADAVAMNSVTAPAATDLRMTLTRRRRAAMRREICDPAPGGAWGRGRGVPGSSKAELAGGVMVTSGGA